MDKQRFLVTGGSQGIGAALVGLARGEGHDVVFTRPRPGTHRAGGGRERRPRAAGRRGAAGRQPAHGRGVRRADGRHRRAGEQRRRRLPRRDRGHRHGPHAGAVRHQRLRPRRPDEPRRPDAQGAAARLRLQRRLDLRHEGGQGGHRLRREQVGAARHQPELADGSSGPTACTSPASARPRCRRTGWARTGRNNPNKLYAADIAEAIMAVLRMHPRALWPEFAVFANNPWKED